LLFVFDLDGVVYRGDTAVPGAVPALRRLEESGHLLYYLTNNSTRSRADYAAKLTRLGIPAHPERIMTSAYATGLYIQEQGGMGKTVALIGEHGLADEMRLAGLRVLESNSPEQAGFVVVGLDRDLTFAKLASAYRQVAGGARFIATNRDGTYPMEEGREIPGGGAMVAALEACAGPAEVTIGKPELTTWRQILELAGVKAGDAVMVGDRAETDILGARQVGMRTILVLTGVTREQDLPRLPEAQQPDYVLPALADLPDFLETEGFHGR
jgi:phosphoglycolate/pyridoxal phosphate phosphatase family enzyme